MTRHGAHGTAPRGAAHTWRGAHQHPGGAEGRNRLVSQPAGQQGSALFDLLAPRCPVGEALTALTPHRSRRLRHQGGAQERPFPNRRLEFKQTPATSSAQVACPNRLLGNSRLSLFLGPPTPRSQYMFECI